MADEAAWVFVGVLVGVPLGIVVGWVLAQLAQPKASTVLIEKTDHGYIIHER